MRMRQSLADFEAAFAQETALDRDLDHQRLRQAAQRTRRRHVEQQHRRGTIRFALLVLTLLATAVGVTVLMFQMIYLVMG